MEQKKKPGFLQSRKFKYGSAALLFTVIVIALVIAVNAVFSALCNANRWFIDMTEEEIYSVSDASVEILNALNEREDLHVKIIFCDDRDVLERTYYQRIIIETALSYADTFDFVDVEFLDIERYPSSVSKYKTSSADVIDTSNVIIENGDVFRVFNTMAFYYQDTDTNKIFAFNGEYKITSTILQLTNTDHPIAYFTTGHGEKTENSELWRLFEEAGYLVKTIDLTHETLADDAQVIVINGPVYDFIGAYSATGGYSEVNEIDVIADFLDTHRNLMVFLDPDAMAKQSFPELSELLAEYGVSFSQSVVRDLGNSISSDGYSLVTVYADNGDSGSSVSDPIRALGNPPKTIMRYAMPIEILWDSKYIDHSDRTVSTILYSGNKAVSHAIGDTGTVTGSGPFSLLTLTQEVKFIDNYPHISYVVVGGTTLLTDPELLASNAYGNADIVFSLMRAMGKENVPVDIDLKMFADTSLDITTAEAYTWTAVLTLFVPIVAAAICIVVRTRRRHL